MFHELEAQFLLSLLKLVLFLAQMHKNLPCRIGFLSAFLGSTEIGFLLSVLVILTTVFVLCVVCAPPCLLR